MLLLVRYYRRVIAVKPISATAPSESTAASPGVASCGSDNAGVVSKPRLMNVSISAPGLLILLYRISKSGVDKSKNIRSMSIISFQRVGSI